MERHPTSLQCEVMSVPVRIELTPTETLHIHRILSSKIATRVFCLLEGSKSLNINAIALQCRCSNGNAVKHLKDMVKLGVVKEEWIGGQHIYRYVSNEVAKFLGCAIRMMEEGG